MALTLNWSLFKYLKRFFIVLTLACAVYTAYFLLINSNVPVQVDNVPPVTEEVVLTPQLELKLPAYETAASVVQSRDIFSSSPIPASATGTADQTPTGQLPSNLKVVGIVIAHPSQIIVEDTSSKQSYFINEDKPQAGISIARIEKDQIIINYQGQSISVPVNNPTASDHAQTP